MLVAVFIVIAHGISGEPSYTHIFGKFGPDLGRLSHFNSFLLNLLLTFVMLKHQPLNDSALLLRSHLLAVVTAASLLDCYDLSTWQDHFTIICSVRVLINVDQLILSGRQLLALQKFEDISCGSLETAALTALLGKQMLEARQ